MKIVLPLGLLIALVFGVTYITQFTPTPRRDADGAGPGAAAGPPVEFATQTIEYSPGPGDRSAVELINYYFPGFFEVGTDRNMVGFMFRSNRPDPIKVSALPPSCGACTSARGAILPPEAVNAYLAKAAAGRLWGPGPAPDLLSALGWAELYANLQWHTFDFARPDQMMTVPGAAAGDRPWGLIELAFKIASAGPPSAKHAYFELYAADGTKITPLPLTLTVTIAGREPIEVYPLELDVGDLGPGAPPRTVELYVFSATREADRLPPPTLAPAAVDPFLTVGPAVPLTAGELKTLEGRVLGEYKAAIRARGGYRFAVTFRREADGRTHDIGKVDRDLYVASTGVTKTYKINLHGTVSGLVRLEGGKPTIELGTYEASYQKKATARVIADRPELELELVPGECQPAFVKYTLGPPETESGRRSWPVQMNIDRNAGRSPPWTGALVLRTKGPNPTTIRIPVSGHGK
jgi:hypothetical protein